MLGSALGADAPDVFTNPGVRAGTTGLKELKGKQSPEQLTRVMAHALIFTPADKPMPYSR
jgi:hypothetical protein